jgi:hypothetical protein
VIETGDDQSIERNAIRKSDESLFDSVEAPVMVEVLRVDVGNHGDGRNEMEKRAIRFVRLGDE